MNWKSLIDENGHVTIPEGVTAIDEHAFNGYNVTGVDIPKGVKKIGFAAFSKCSGLTSVVIPKSVSMIDGYAFNQCTGLKSVVIPKGVERISTYAFLTVPL